MQMLALSDFSSVPSRLRNIKQLAAKLLSGHQPGFVGGSPAA